MKREEFMKHLRRYGCYIKREGSSHTIVQNIKNGASETVPRHNEIDNVLVKKICGLTLRDPLKGKGARKV